MRLEAKQDAQRHGDGDDQQRSVDEDADRHGWREKRGTKRASGAAELREGERASVGEDLAMDGFGGWNRWRGKGFGPQRRCREKRDESQSVSDTRRRTGTVTCTSTGCLGRMYSRDEAGTSANSRLMGGAVPVTAH